MTDQFFLGDVLGFSVQVFSLSVEQGSQIAFAVAFLWALGWGVVQARSLWSRQSD